MIVLGCDGNWADPPDLSAESNPCWEREAMKTEKINFIAAPNESDLVIIDQFIDVMLSYKNQIGMVIASLDMHDRARGSCKNERMPKRTFADKNHPR